MAPASSIVHFDAPTSPGPNKLSPKKLKAGPFLTERQRDALIEDLKLERKCARSLVLIVLLCSFS